jgi:parvulin-like peptidyl-prolyl isomerase
VEVGTTFDPYIDSSTYFIHRLVQKAMRPDSIKASHILFMFKDAPGLNPQAGITRTKEQAKALADSVLNVLKGKAADFGALAMLKSDYPTAKEDSGSLNWILDGDYNMKFFFDSCLLMKPGEMRVILSSLGYHVIYMQEQTKPIDKVKVATITREIIPLKKTYDSYFSKASEFASNSRTADAFNQSIASKGLNKRSAQAVQKMRFQLPGLDVSREIIQWAFNEKTEKGMVSHVFDAQGIYVVALLVERREKGIAALDQVKTYIEPLVKREKKAEKLMAQMKTAIGGTKDLNAIAAKLNVKVDTVSTLTFGTINLPNYGPEPSIVGTIFTLKPNALSAPLKGDMGVYVVQVDGFLEPPATQDYTMLKYQWTSYFYQRIQNGVFTAIKDKTEIVDNRIYYY